MSVSLRYNNMWLDSKLYNKRFIGLAIEYSSYPVY